MPCRHVWKRWRPANLPAPGRSSPQGWTRWCLLTVQAPETVSEARFHSVQGVTGESRSPLAVDTRRIGVVMLQMSGSDV